MVAKHRHPYAKKIGDLPALPLGMEWEWQIGGHTLRIMEHRHSNRPWHTSYPLARFFCVGGLWQVTNYYDDTVFPKYDDFHALLGHFLAYWRVMK